MRRVMCVVLVVVVAVGGAFVRAGDVDGSIARAKQFLYSAQTPEGNWEEIPQIDLSKLSDPMSVRGNQYTARTALVTYALLKSGEKPGDPRLAKAIEYLKKSPQPFGTYALAFRILVWQSLPPSPELKKLAKRDSDRILSAVTRSGLSSYAAPFTQTVDLSNSQVAALGLFIAGEMGIEIPTTYWRQVDRAFRDRQRKDGAFPYSPDQNNESYRAAHPGMTAAGLATLLQAAEATTSVNAAMTGNQTDKAVLAAEKWLAENFGSLFGVYFSADRSLYALYALERAGVAGGIKRFGQHVWYEEGANFVLSKQLPNGSWLGGVTEEKNGVVDTAFAVMFLSNARSPVLISKLKYNTLGNDKKTTVEANWNQRSRDVARVTRWVAEQAETLNRWQVADLDASPADMLDARVLYISGDQAVVWNDQQKSRIKDYIDRGGFAIFSADQKSKQFIDAITNIMSELYPKANWRELPADHPIYVAQQFRAAKWKKPLGVHALTNGSRELCVLVTDGDLARSWMAGYNIGRPESYELAANLIQYAGEVGSVQEASPSPTAAPNRKVSIARLPIAGEEARAWLAFSDWARKNAFSATMTSTDLAPGSLTPAIKLVHLAVDDPNAELQDLQIAELKRYVSTGGRILFEANGGDAGVATRLVAFVAEQFPEATTVELAALNKQGYRPSLRPVVAAAGRTLADSLIVKETKTGGVIAISKLDLSSGLAGAKHTGILGLTVEGSRNFVAELLFYKDDVIAFPLPMK